MFLESLSKVLQQNCIDCRINRTVRDLENIADSRKHWVGVVAATSEVHVPPDDVLDVREDEAQPDDDDGLGDVLVGFLSLIIKSIAQVIIYPCSFTPNADYNDGIENANDCNWTGVEDTENGVDIPGFEEQITVSERSNKRKKCPKRGD